MLSEIVRRSAADKNGDVFCYTCNKKMHWKESQAGHGIGGRTGSVLLDRDILRPQCVGCNVFKRGEYPVFVTKLIRENGLDWWEDKLSSSKQVTKWNRAELEVLIESFKHELESLE